jgi:hypothetical protein
LYFKTGLRVKVRLSSIARRSRPLVIISVKCDGEDQARAQRYNEV